MSISGVGSNFLMGRGSSFLNGKKFIVQLENKFHKLHYISSLLKYSLERLGELQPLEPPFLRHWIISSGSWIDEITLLQLIYSCMHGFYIILL